MGGDACHPGANPWAGEVALVVDGTPRRMKLTLGALAELEASLGAEGLIPLVERFEAGRFGARDVAALVAAGLRGGGLEVSPEQVLAADVEGGPLAAARAAAELLARAFTLPGSGPGVGPSVGSGVGPGVGPQAR